MTDAADGGAFGAFQKRLFIPGEKLDESGGFESVAGMEIQFRGELGEAVPGADQLAVVAAVDAVTDQGA